MFAATRVHPRLADPDPAALLVRGLQANSTQHEPWLGSFFLASTAGLAILDPDLRFIRINQTLAVANGRSIEDHLGRTLQEVLPQLGPLLEPVLKSVIATGQPLLDYEVSGETPASPGRVRHWCASYFPLAMFHGGPRGVGVVAAEVTERKEAEEKLRTQQRQLQQSEQLWRSIFAAAHDAILVHDEEFRLLACNGTAERMYGYGPGEMVGAHLLDVQGAVEPQAQCPATLVKQKARWETVHRRKDGTRFAVEVSTLPFSLAGEPRFVQTVRDITEWKVAAGQIRFQASLLDQVCNAVIATDLDGRILYWNPFAEKLYGWTAAEVMGRQSTEVNVPSDQAERAREIIAGLAGGEAWQGEFIMQRRDGTRFPVWASGTPLRDEDGQVIGFIGVSLDISESKRVALELAQSREQLRRFAVRMDSIREEEAQRISREVHDALGQQLTALKLDLQHLEENLPPGKRGLHRQCERMHTLLDETLLAAQRISSELRLGHLDVVGLAEAMMWQLAEFGRRTGIACRNAGVKEIAEVSHASATAAFRILQEALTNIARHAKAANVTLELDAAGPDLVLAVSDDGRGITAAELSHPQAIGLLGMRERAAAVGGTLEIAPGAVKGTTVRAVLPRLAPS